LVLDGEIVLLLNDFKSDFTVVQKRGRMRKEELIRSHSKAFPCHLAVFDLLKLNGKPQIEKRYDERKKQLLRLFQSVKLPTSIQYERPAKLQMVPAHQDSEMLWKK